MRFYSVFSLSALHIAALFGTAAHAVTMPPELTVGGQPLPSACINHLVNALSPDGETIDINECASLKSEPNETIRAEFLGRMRGGFVLLSTWERSDSADSASAESMGKFSDISIIRRKGDKLSLHREVAAGDRCNGGVTEAWMERGKLFYKINLTPYDMVAYADTSTSLKASDDLESSATSCFAIGTFLHTQDSQPVLQLVTLNQDNIDALLSDTNWPRNYRYQTCFNKHFLDSINAGATTLDKPALGAWVKQFYDGCVTQNTIETKPLEAAPVEPVTESVVEPKPVVESPTPATDDDTVSPTPEE